MGSKDSNDPEKADGKAVQAAAASPGWVQVPTTVNDEVRRLIWRFGADAVKRAIKEETKTKRGPKKKPDWKELREVVEADARDWLEGRDPFKLRTNHAIAKMFAESRPGHSAISTFDRIKRKLRIGPYNRRWYILVTAEGMSRDTYPHAAYLRTLEALSKLPDANDVWGSMLEMARASIADYERLKGEAPAPTLSIGEIKEAVLEARQPLNALFPRIGSGNRAHADK